MYQSERTGWGSYFFFKKDSSPHCLTKLYQSLRPEKTHSHFTLKGLSSIHLGGPGRNGVPFDIKAPWGNLYLELKLGLLCRFGLSHPLCHPGLNVKLILDLRSLMKIFGRSIIHIENTQIQHQRQKMCFHYLNVIGHPWYTLYRTWKWLLDLYWSCG